MNFQRVDQMLAIGLNDTGAEFYSPQMRVVAISEACRAYSRYRSLLRRFGTGALYQDIQIGALTLYSVGFAFAVGTVITLDSGLPWSESFTIDAVEPTGPNDLLIGSPLKLTLHAAATKKHIAGAFITQPTLGLAIVAGQDTYNLPADWISPDFDSWTRVTGQRRPGKERESFEDGIYQFSEAIGGVGFGLSQTFRGSSSFGGGFVGVQASGGNLNVPTSQGCRTYTFTDGTPPRLQITPAPTASAVYDFQYVAQRLPQDVPDHDVDALLNRAKASAYRQRAGLFAGGTPAFREADVAMNPGENAKALTDQAESCEKQWDIAIRQRPYITSG